MALGFLKKLFNKNNTAESTANDNEAIETQESGLTNIQSGSISDAALAEEESGTDTDMRESVSADEERGNISDIRESTSMETQDINMPEAVHGTDTNMPDIQSNTELEMDPAVMSEFKLAGEGAETEGDEFTAALNKLLEEDSKVELKDVNYDYIKDVAVYDTVRNDKDEAIQEIASDDIRNIKIKHDEMVTKTEKFSPAMLGILIVMVILVVSAFIGFFTAVDVITTRKIEGDFQGEAVSQNKRSVSAANYIYTENTQPYGDKDLTLIKVLVDSAATVFYFDGELDMRNATFTLTDDKNNEYALDLNAFANLDFDNGTTQVRFEPLKAGINALKLTVKGLNTGNIAVFDVIFDKPVSLPKIAYLKDKTNVKYRSDDFTVKVSYLEYSGAGSRVEYMIENGEDNSFDVVQKQKNNGEYVRLKENTGEKLKIWREPVFYTFENDRATLGRVDFSALNDMEGNTTIEIDNLYKRYKTDLTIPASNLSQGGESDVETAYELGDYKVVFEGLKGYEDAYYLVLHCEDKNAQVIPDDEYANRKEVLLDAQLILGSSDGMQITLDGTSTAASYGTDMIFPINDITKGIVQRMSRGDIVLQVSNIYIRVDDVSIDISTQDLRFEKPYLRNQFETIIKDAFEDRLEYKAGGKSINDIEGFSAALKQNKSLMTNYEPLEGIENVKSTVQITALDVENDLFYGIVMESMEYEKEGTVCYFYRTHKIRGKRSGNIWLIDQDNIIS